MNSTSLNQTFGEFFDDIPQSDEYLTLNFSPSRLARKQRWNNYGISADFLGDYFSAFFPGDEVPDSKINLKDTIKASVSFIANELLENAVKFSDEASNLPVSITLYLYEKELIFQVINYANLEDAKNYQNFIRNLVNSDPNEFYMIQLEKAALGMGESQMGLLTMINDYFARFGWKFQMVIRKPEVIQITVMVKLEL